MNKLIKLIPLLLLSLAACHDGGDHEGSLVGMPSPDGPGSPGQNQPGVITAGEWNDLQHWDFWTDLLRKEDYEKYPGYWSFFHNNRVSVRVMGTDGLPVVDAPVTLKRAGVAQWVAKTDNKGYAELWLDLFQQSAAAAFTGLSLEVNDGAHVLNTVKPYAEGINEIVLPPSPKPNQVEIAFVMDATGSMGDELEYLKTELLDVIGRVKNENPGLSLSTSSVFYRDQGDEYVTRVSPFSSDPNTTLNFIRNQSAGGGGDFPEAVHTALETALQELQWSAGARARILFLLLDAPPHYKPEVLASLHASIPKAAERGIRIVPITASGIDKETEFLMRFFALSTNGSYVFITDHSGIGESHLEPSVGEYEVEFLNNLMVRLIKEYAE